MVIVPPGLMYLAACPNSLFWGPYLLYVNDIPDIVDSTILLFADDIKIFRCIKSHEDYIWLQSDLNCLSEWSFKWKLKFNVSKCNTLHLGTKENNTYFLCGTAIQSAQSFRDLGVMIDQDLKFHEHTSLVTNKANHILGLIKRRFSYLDSNMLVHLYRSMVYVLY